MRIKCKKLSDDLCILIRSDSLQHPKNYFIPNFVSWKLITFAGNLISESVIYVSYV